MARGLDNKSVESLVVDLAQGVLDVNLLNLAKSNQRTAFFQALEERPGLLTKVSKANEEQFFSAAIKKNPEYFVHLCRNQYTNELAQIYLYTRLSNDSKEKAEESILVSKSLDNKVVFTMSYLSGASDELYYLDRELKVPLSLRSNVILTLKLDDAVALIDKLDTHITQLGEQKIKSAITDLVANQYKAYLNSYINEKEIGYYTLCTSLTDVEAGFKDYVAKVFAPYGITISNFVIKYIAIPKDIQNKLEDQAFKIRQRRADVEADSEFSKISLDSYAAKLELHKNYPDAEITLTEYEKDLALKRYLIKTGKNEEECVDRTIDISKQTLRADSTVAKPEDVIPDIPVKANIFRRNYIMLLILSLAISLITFSSSKGWALILLGVTFFIFGIVAAFNVQKFATVKIEPSAPLTVDQGELAPMVSENEEKED